jgi:NAD kinase
MRADSLDYEKKLLKLISGKEGKDYFVYELMRLETSVNGKKLDAIALNDVLVSPIYVRRIMDSEMTVKGKKSRERNSGIIIYTPTGSHAFAHSACAKKMSYDSEKMGIVALAPYSGSLKKGEILTDGRPVTVECLDETGEVCIDGSEVNLLKLKKGDRVTVKKSSSPVRLVGFVKRFHP